MGEVNYQPLIDDMVWSFSRIQTYDDCPFRWYLRYICRDHEQDKFYASYGSNMHRLIERFYKGELTKEQMLTEYLVNFRRDVKGVRPKESTFLKYLNGGIEYLKNFQHFPFKMLSVEEEVNFEIDGIPFTGFIDFLGTDEDGEFAVVDNKSRDLKPRSTRSKPTRKDEELDEVLRQLYLYCAAVEQKYGKLPKWLCFNCFRTGVFIKEPFRQEAYEEAKKWALDRIKQIREDDEFLPKPDAFSCYWICGVDHECNFAECWKTGS